MTASNPGTPSARQTELLERAYRYVLVHGLVGMSLRPLADAIDSSPRVLLFLFGSKEELLRALLERARSDERELLETVRSERGTLADAVIRIWDWLADPGHRQLLVLWTEAYSRSLVEPSDAWAGFARDTVTDWLTLLAESQSTPRPDAVADMTEQTAALAILRGNLLDLLATSDLERTTRAVRYAATHLFTPPG